MAVELRCTALYYQNRAFVETLLPSTPLKNLSSRMCQFSITVDVSLSSLNRLLAIIYASSHSPPDGWTTHAIYLSSSPTLAPSSWGSRTHSQSVVHRSGEVKLGMWPSPQDNRACGDQSRGFLHLVMNSEPLRLVSSSGRLVRLACRMPNSQVGSDMQGTSRTMQTKQPITTSGRDLARCGSAPSLGAVAADLLARLRVRDPHATVTGFGSRQDPTHNHKNYCVLNQSTKIL